jgi:hypothetical protein
VLILTRSELTKILSSDSEKKLYEDEREKEEKR